MKVGSSAGKETLAVRFIAVGIVMLFVLSGTMGILERSSEGDMGMVEGVTGEGSGCVTGSGNGDEGVSHGEWKDRRGGGYKGDRGGRGDVTHVEQDSFGGSWFDDFDDFDEVFNTDTLINGVKFEFENIPSGSFWMGSPAGVGSSNEQPRHQVKFSNGFQMGKYEVTQAQWEAVMGSNPSHDYGVGDNNPVYYVSWNDCQSFISQLNGLDPGHTYRLPSEAEWEYACRAGTNTKYYYGDNAGQLGNYAWYDSNSNSETHQVGGKLPNVWGLYDMHGNVWEWCEDDWHGNYTGAPANGESWGDGSGSFRVFRGGGWISLADSCRLANRGYYYPDFEDSYLGLRLIRELKGITLKEGKVQLAEKPVNPGDGCVGYWSFDEGSGDTAFDGSGNGNDGTVKGSALEFDGVDDQVDCGNDASLNASEDGFSFEAWVKPNIGYGQVASVKIIFKGSHQLNIVPSTGNAKFEVYNQSLNEFHAVDTEPIPTGVWTHLVGVYGSDKKPRLYRNGELVAVGAAVVGNLYDDSIRSLEIGGTGGGADRWFNGSIDDVRFYNRVLGQNEVAEHYSGIYNNETGLVGGWHFSEGSGTTINDFSGNGNHGTLGGDGVGSDLPIWTTDAPSKWTEGKFGNALNFNGVDDYVELPQIQPSEFTISTWFKREIVARQTLVSCIQTDGYYGYRLQFYSDNGDKVNIYLGSSTGGATYHVNGITPILEDTWYHVAATLDELGNLKLFLNGHQEGTTTTGAVTEYTGSEVPFIGRAVEVGHEQYFEGTIDEVRIYNRTLTSSQIRQHYNDFCYATNANLTSTPINLSKNMHWDSLALAKTEPSNTYINVSIINASTNQTIPGYENLTAQNIDISNITADPIRLKAWFSGDGCATPSLDSWGVEWTAENAWRDSFVGDGKCISPVEIDNHTVGYWRFDEGKGNVARDISGNGNDGTLKNMEEEDWVDGRYGKALEFDGKNDYVDLSNYVNNLNLFKPATFEFLLKSRVDNCMPLFSISDGLNNNLVHITIGNGATGFLTNEIITINRNLNGHTDYRIGYTTTNRDEVFDGKWHSIVVTFENQIRIFLDGYEKTVSVGSGSNNGIFGNILGASKVYVGQRTSGGEFFNGTIDEVRISNVSRTPEEIRQAYQAGIAIRGGQAQLGDNEIVPDGNTSALWHFNEGEGHILRDSSGNGNDGVIHGANWTEGVMRGALEFDGVDDYIEVPDDDSLDFGTNSFTVEAWVKSKSSSIGNIMAKRTTGSYPGWEIDFGSGHLGWYLSDSVNVKPNTVDADTINDGQWHQTVIVFNRENNQITRFIDGFAYGTLDDFGSVGSLSSASTFGIAARPNSQSASPVDSFFNGTIDEVAIYNRALSPAEIRASANLYHTNATLHSVPITLPVNSIWSTFHCNRTVPKNTFLNISIHDATTNKTLTINTSQNSTIDLNDINAFEHPSIYLNASFESNGTVTPVLYDWAVNWTPVVEPELVLPIPDISIIEDTPQADILNVSQYFYDCYADIRPSSYLIQYDDTNITLQLNGTMLNLVRLADNFTGKVAVHILCTNVYDRTTASNIFNISVTGENDAPLWCSTPATVVLDEDTTVTTEWSLYDHILDVEYDEMEFSIFSGNPFISAEALDDGRINISASRNYNGGATLIVTARESSGGPEAPGNVTIPITVNPVNDPPTAELLLPADGSILSDTTVTFEWKGFDIDNPLSDLTFRLDLGTSKIPSIHTSDITGSRITVSGLAEGETYYWRIIPSDNEGNGVCLNGTWSFTIGTNATVPTVILCTPLNGSIKNSTDVNLTWDIINLEVGEPIYHIYLGTERDNLTEIAKSLDDWHLLADLEDNTTYYWKVIPVVGALVGRCSGGIWSFAVDTAFEVFYNITVDIDVTSIDIIHGENATFNMTFTNNGNVPTMVEIYFSGKLAGFVNCTKKIILSLGEDSTIPISIIDTASILPDEYDFIIEITHPGGTQTFTIPVNITSGEPVIDDDMKKEPDSNWLFLTLGIVLLIILAIGIFFVIGKKRSSEDDEAEDLIEADIVKPGESPFSQPQQAPPPVQQPAPQFAPSVKHEYAQKTGRAVPSAFPASPQAPKEEVRSIESILADVKPQMAPPPQSPAVPAPPPQVEQLPLRADTPGVPSVSPAPQPIPSGPQIVGIDMQFSISDIFLIYVDGRLVKSVSFGTKLSEGMDEDIMSGMLTAITDFIKDSFLEETGALKTLQYGKMTIYLERGVGMYLAVVFHGHPPHNLREKMRWLLIHLWERFKLKLKVWDGSYDGLDGLDSMLRTLMGQTEPAASETAAQPAPKGAGASTPIISTAAEAVMCNICMGVVKPGLAIMTCNCGNKFHKACGERIGTCPRCNTSLIIPITSPPPTTVAPMEKVPVPVGFRRKARDQLNVSFNGMKWEPSGLMPPPPEEIMKDDTKMVPEYSGQKAGEKTEFRI